MAGRLRAALLRLRDMQVGGKARVGCGVFAKCVTTNSSRITGTTMAATYGTTKQGSQVASVVIGTDVGLGARAIVPGSQIGDAALGGARAVVTKDVAPYTIMAGLLARRIGRRS